MSLAPKQDIPFVQSITQSLFHASWRVKIRICNKRVVIHDHPTSISSAIDDAKTFIIHTQALAIMEA